MTPVGAAAASASTGGLRRRPHSRPKAVPTACLGYARMFGEGREWRGWEDFFSLGKEMK